MSDDGFFSQVENILSTIFSSSGLKGMALNLEPDNVGVVVFGNDKLIKEVGSCYAILYEPLNDSQRIDFS